MNNNACYNKGTKIHNKIKLNKLNVEGIKHCNKLQLVNCEQTSKQMLLHKVAVFR